MKSSRQVVTAIVFGMCGLLLSSCGGTNNADTKQLDSKGELRKGLVLVNVLDKQMFDDCHIKGSVNIPVEQIAECENCIDKDAEVVLYCSNFLCSSSDYAARKLRASGFNRVAVYSGGTAEWYQKGLPVEGPARSAYLTNQIQPVTETQDDGMVVVTCDELACKMGIVVETAPSVEADQMEPGQEIK